MPFSGTINRKFTGGRTTQGTVDTTGTLTRKFTGARAVAGSLVLTGTLVRKLTLKRSIAGVRVRYIEMLERACGTIEYAKRQIVQNARYMLTGNMGRLGSISPNEWTCSETVFKCLPSRMREDLGLGERFMYDWISPSGKLFGLYEMIQMSNVEYSHTSCGKPYCV